MPRKETTPESLRKLRSDKAIGQWTTGNLYPASHSQTDVSKENISRAKGGLLIKLGIIFARGGSADDAAELTDSSWESVRQTIYKLMREGKISPSTKNISRVQKPSPSLENNGAFAKKILDLGFLGKEPDIWEEIISFYTQQERPQPPSFADRLRLEAYYKAKKQAFGGNPKLIRQYMELGQAMDLSWFNDHLAEEEVFLSKAAKFAIEQQQGIIFDAPKKLKLSAKDEKYETPDIDSELTIFDPARSKIK